MEEIIRKTKLALAYFCRFGEEKKRVAKSEFAFYLLLAAFFVGLMPLIIAFVFNHGIVGRVFCTLAIPIACWWLDKGRGITEYFNYVESNLSSLPSPAKTQRGEFLWNNYVFSVIMSLRFFLTFILLSSNWNIFWLAAPMVVYGFLYARLLYWEEIPSWDDRNYLKLIGLFLLLGIVIGFFVTKVFSVFLVFLLLIFAIEFVINYLNKRVFFNITKKSLKEMSEIISLLVLLIGVLVLG